MSLEAKRIIVAILSVAVVVVLGYVVFTERAARIDHHKVVIKADSAGCVKCHGTEYEGGPGADPGLVAHWEASVHATQGVGCMECHGVPEPGAVDDLRNPRYMVETTWDRASGLKSVSLVTEEGKPRERPDMWMHEGAMIVTDVSPRTCGLCHRDETEQVFNSHHSSAAQFIGSVDNFLGMFAEGPAAAVQGCQQCHGSIVKVASNPGNNKAVAYTAESWPNTGMGRVNADGSWGACSACHSRHEFSAGVARRPDNCGKCHMGPDHPQLEVYYESKHGIAYRSRSHEMNLDLPGGEWIAGDTYTQAPTCATCHMSAAAPHGNYQKLEATHDVGARISWTLRPKVSVKPPGITADDGTVILPGPEARRDAMKQACITCHSSNWVDNFYVQFDNAVELYNNKYGKPSVAIYNFLKQEEIVDSTPMNEEIDYLFFEIWHHEGRRARHGASMGGPDYVQWHGFYELSKRFYTEFLPLAVELAEEAGKGHEVESFIHDTLRGEDGSDWEKYHKWTEGLTREQRAEMLQWEEESL